MRYPPECQRSDQQADGGYFGSRLNKSVREEKGYTYGIGASVSSFADTSHFSVRTRTRCDVVNEVIDTVRHLSDLAHARRASRLVLVASGARDTHTVVVEKTAGAKGLFARFKKKKALNVQAFLSEEAK